MTTLKAVLGLAFLTMLTIGVVHGEKVLRMSYRFAFEDEGVLVQGREPTQEEVEAVLCETDVFFSKSFQQKLNNPKIAVVIKDVDFAFEDYQFTGEDGSAVEMPANINFTLDVMTMAGTTPPTFAAIQDALPNLDYNAYLTKFVWKAAPVTKNYFFEAVGLVWMSKITDSVEGSISVVGCPEGAQPEALVEGAQTGEYSCVHVKLGILERS